jgi:MFS transporter, UMF1 family
MYDFANSGYTTVVITAIFNTYFVAAVAGNAPWATFAWTLTLAAAYTLNMASAPVVGAYADLHAAKKRLLALTTIGCVLCTAALALVGPGDIALAVVLLIASNFFFSTGENLAAAFLPELAAGSALARLSGQAWAFGYIGGLISLGACLAYIASAEAQGHTASQFVPVTMLITAGLFALAALPAFWFLRERAQPQIATSGHVVRDAFARLGQTWREARMRPDLTRFLVCIVFYQAGVQTVVALAAVYAEQVMGFRTRETITMILVVNLAAAAGALGFGYVQDRVGHVRTLAITLVAWLLTVTLAWFATDKPTFWAAATLAGLCLGATQSGGRALVGYLTPAGREGEYFGLWGLAMKLGQALGPVAYGVVTWVTLGNHRLAIIATGLTFVVSLVLLRRVDAERGRTQALSGV